MNTRVFLRGGLGNQFFQWVYALSLHTNGQRVALDSSFLRKMRSNQATGQLELEKVFTELLLPIQQTSGLWRVEHVATRIAKLLGLLQTESTSLQTVQKVAPFQYGYYQQAHHFTPQLQQQVHALVQPHFRHKDPRLTHYAAIHIRGGDYATSRYNRNQIGKLSLTYYRRVFSILTQQYPHLIWLIVSDDYPWARHIARELQVTQAIFLDTHLGGRETALDALKALRNADVLFCANSSFSAMAGYLGQTQTVYAPTPWFRGPRLAHVNPVMANWHPIESVF